MEKERPLHDACRKALTALLEITLMAGLTVSAYATVGAFNTANEVGKNVQSNLLDLAKTFLPLALVITFFLILFTHDQKLLMAEIKFALTLLVVYAFIRITASGKLLETFDEIGVDGMVMIHSLPQSLPFA